VECGDTSLPSNQKLSGHFNTIDRKTFDRLHETRRGFLCKPCRRTPKLEAIRLYGAFVLLGILGVTALATLVRSMGGIFPPRRKGNRSSELSKV
jgi:hypothetical protein